MSIETVLLGFVVVGFAGSAIEKIGAALKYPRVEAFGKAIESITADGPKFLENLVAVFSGKFGFVAKLFGKK